MGFGGFGVWGLGFGVWGLGFGVWGLGFGGLVGLVGLGCRVSGPGSGLGLRLSFCALRRLKDLVVLSEAGMGYPVQSLQGYIGG